MGFLHTSSNTTKTYQRIHQSQDFWAGQLTQKLDSFRSNPQWCPVNGLPGTVPNAHSTGYLQSQHDKHDLFQKSNIFTFHWFFQPEEHLLANHLWDPPTSQECDLQLMNNKLCQSIFDGLLDQYEQPDRNVLSSFCVENTKFNANWSIGVIQCGIEAE